MLQHGQRQLCNPLIVWRRYCFQTGETLQVLSSTPQHFCGVIGFQPPSTIMMERYSHSRGHTPLIAHQLNRSEWPCLLLPSFVPYPCSVQRVCVLSLGGSRSCAQVFFYLFYLIILCYLVIIVLKSDRSPPDT